MTFGAFVYKIYHSFKKSMKLCLECTYIYMADDRHLGCQTTGWQHLQTLANPKAHCINQSPLGDRLPFISTWGGIPGKKVVNNKKTRAHFHTKQNWVNEQFI